jgi:hypothetical protein
MDLKKTSFYEDLTLSKKKGHVNMLINSRIPYNFIDFFNHLNDCYLLRYNCVLTSYFVDI